MSIAKGEASDWRGWKERFRKKMVFVLNTWEEGTATITGYRACSVLSISNCKGQDVVLSVGGINNEPRVRVGQDEGKD